ncbi:MAG: Flp pilus assembly protein CpaB [Actinomycetota bacterium]
MKGVSLGKRATSLVLAVGLAALASVALVTYVHGLERKAYAGVETVDVYVAKSSIPVGTTAEQAASKGMIDKTPVPQKVVAEGAVTSLDQIRGQVAGVTILPGVQLLVARWTTPDHLGSSLPIPSDRQAITVQVDTPNGVGGFIQPGDHVSLLAQFELSVPKNGVWANVTDPSIVRFLLQDVPVLAVGQKIAGAQTDGSGSRGAAKDSKTTSGSTSDSIMLTLAVKPGDAEKVAYAAFGGKMWFTLLPPGQGPTRTSGRNPLNIFN